MLFFFWNRSPFPSLYLFTSKLQILIHLRFFQRNLNNWEWCLCLWPAWHWFSDYCLYALFILMLQCKLTFDLVIVNAFIWSVECCASKSGGRISSGGIKSDRNSRGLRTAPVPEPVHTQAAAPSVTVVHSAPTVVHAVPAYGVGYHTPTCGKL